MELIIDNRETLKSEFQHVSWARTENLALGDYIFQYQGDPVVIIERKTVEDMANSIRDGRYREQKARLFDSYPVHKIMYLIEGDLTIENGSIHYNKVSKSTIYSSLFNLLLRDHLNLFITNNVQESVEFLHQLAAKIQKHGKKFLTQSSSRTCETTLFDSKKVSGKKNMTPQLVYKLQLSAIPGVSSKVADCLISTYPSLHNLMLELGSMDADQRFDVVCNLKQTSTNGKTRRLGKRVAKNVCDYLFPPTFLPRSASPTDANDPAGNSSTGISSS